MYVKLTERQIEALRPDLQVYLERAAAAQEAGDRVERMLRALHEGYPEKVGFNVEEMAFVPLPEEQESAGPELVD